MASPALTQEQFARASAKDKYNVVKIVAHLQSIVPTPPDVGVICGSGLSELHEILSDRVSVPYETIPGFPQSTVQGHAGELVFGKIGAVSVVLMRGRFHFYEGYEPSRVAMPVRVMAALGVRGIIVTNASGGVNPAYEIGDFMVIQDHISFPGLSGVSPLMGENDSRFGPRFPAITPAYDGPLQELALVKARDLDLSFKMRRGTYIGVSGPSYETPHEIGAMRVLGGDAVGMSTVPEIIQAAHCGVPILGLALVSNKCKGPGDTHVNPSHEEVLDSVNKGSADMRRLVSAVIAAFPVESYGRSVSYDLFAKYAATVAATAPAPAPAAAAAAAGSCPFSGKTASGGSACPVSGKCGKCCPVVTSAFVGLLAGAIGAAIVLAIAKKK